MNKIKQIKNISLSNMCLIIILSSRLYTWMFTSIFGRKGIYISIIVLTLMFLFAIIKNFEKKGHDVLIFITAVIVILIGIFTTLLNNDLLNFWIFNNEWGFFIKVLDIRKSIFLILALFLVGNIDKIKKSLYIAAVLNFWYCILQITLFNIVGNWTYYFVSSISVNDTAAYNMNLGYEMIFATLVFFMKTWNEQKIKNYIYGVISLAIAFIYGARGIIVVVLAFITLMLLFKNKNLKERVKSIKKIIITLLITTIVGATIVFLGESINRFANVNAVQEHKWGQKALKSRNIEMFKSSSLGQSNGRISIYKLGVQAIKKGEICGNGIFGDRIFVGKDYKWGYSHNIIIEMIASFGVFGVLLIIMLGYLLIDGLVNKDNKFIDIYIIFSALCAKLLVSDSFWFDKYFWGLIAVFYLANKDSAKQMSCKKQIVVLGVSILTLFTILGMYLNKEIEKNDYKPVVVNKPEVALVVYGPIDKKIEFIKNELKENSEKINFAIDTRELEIYNREGYMLPKNKNIYYIDNGDTNVSLLKFKGDVILENLKKSNEILKKNNIYTDTLLYPYGVTDSQVLYNITQKNIFAIAYDDTYAKVYKKINKKDAHNLQALLINKNHNWNNYLKKAKNENALLIMVVNVDDIIEDKEIFINLTKSLNIEGFKFVAMDELLAKTRINPNLSKREKIKIYVENTLNI